MITKDDTQAPADGRYAGLAAIDQSASPKEEVGADVRPGLWPLIATLLAIQVLLTDAGFMYYAFTNNWKLPAEVVMVWLASASAQIILLTLVLVRRDR